MEKGGKCERDDYLGGSGGGRASEPAITGERAGERERESRGQGRESMDWPERCVRDGSSGWLVLVASTSRRLVA